MTHPVRQEPYKTPIITTVGTCAAFGYLATKIFTNVNPIAGAIFTTTWSVLDMLVSKVDNVFNKFLHSADAKFIKDVLCGTCSFILTNHFMKITILEGLKLTALPLYMIAAIIVGLAGILTLFGTIGGIAGIYNYFHRA